MALQSSGAISLSDIQTEFGGGNPISLSEYYRGGAGGSSYTQGGRGGHGYCKLTIGGTNYTFTSTGTHIFTVPS